MSTSKNLDNFENCVIVINDMGNKLKNDIADYFAQGRHGNIQMIVMGHKPAQIINSGRMSCDTIYVTTYNGADLFKHFNDGLNLAFISLINAKFKQNDDQKYYMKMN